MKRTSVRDVTQEWCADRPVVAGVLSGAFVTLLFLTVFDCTVGNILIPFAAFAKLFALTAFNERRRRKKMNRPK